MKTKGIIILTSILVITAGITAYVIIKRSKIKKLKDDCVKNGGVYNEVTKTCELKPKDDVKPKNDKVLPTKEQIEQYKKIPNFADPFGMKYKN